MSNHTWGCFECRKTIRRDALVKGVLLCPGCGVDCTFIGYQTSIPNA